MPNLNDQHFYHFKQYTACDQTPFEKSVTEASQSDTISDQRQGSWNFWSHLGQPSAGEFTVHNGICWEFIDYSSDPSNTGLYEWGVTSPSGSLTPTGTTCAGCVSQIPATVNYHAFRGCFDPGNNVRHVIDGDIDSTLTTASNNAVYVGLGSPTVIGTVTSYNVQCWEYMGEYPIGDPALDYGQWYFYSNTVPWDAVPAVYGTCAGCQAANANTLFHKWKKCTNSTVLNIVGPGVPDDSPSSVAFYQSVGSPNQGDVINMDPSGTNADMCYEYMGDSATAEAGTDVITIGAYITYPNGSSSPCTDCLTPPVNGCTDPSATNYDPNATVDDGSCTYTYGCTDPAATNYSPTATYDDGSCTYCTYGCTDPLAGNYDPNATCDDGSCIVVSQNSGGCDILFGTEVCQPDGTSTIDIDLSTGAGLSNIITTVDGAPYGTSTGCATPPATIPVTGLTEGQTIKVVGECSYQKEDYDRANKGPEPNWAIPVCGESEQLVGNETKVYLYYDGTSLGVDEVKAAYEAVMVWLLDLPDFTVDTVHGSSTQNVFHTAIANERWLDWATSAITGKFNNNNAQVTLDHKWTGGGANSGTVFSVQSEWCNPGSSCFARRDPTTNLYGPSPYGIASHASRAHKICNWSYDTATWTAGGHTWTIDTFYDTSEVDPNGTGLGRTGAPMPDGDNAGNNNGNQLFIGSAPAASTTDDVLVICFADEATFSYHGMGNSFDNDSTYSGGGVDWSNIQSGQPTVHWQADHSEYIAQRTAFINANGKSFKAFLYPSKPGSAGSSHTAFPMHALATIHSGNQDEAGGTGTLDGTWQVGTIPTNSLVTITDLETTNPYWTGTVPTYGGLDQHGWGVNIAEVPFQAQTFVNDLTVFLGSGSTTTICDGSQCLIIKAVDVNGSPVMNYPIKVDGIAIGNTNANGTVSHTLSAAGTAVINDCYTFTAAGSCIQSLITITISEAQITSQLNCILGCTDPLSWNYNPLAGVDDGTCMFPLEEDPRDSMSRCELLKIDTECNFATDVYNLYKNKRYGLDPGCLYNMDGRASKKYSSDWVDRLLPDYGAETFTKIKHINGATPKPDWVDATDCGTTKRTCDGSECIVIIVENKDGDRIPDYEIVLDGLYAGKTDSLGVLRLSIPNAAEGTEHKINLCHCFTTTGNCNSQKITITVDGLDCDDCGNIKMF